MRHAKLLMTFSSGLALVATGGTAIAQDAPESGALGEIVVTANKREQSINDVGVTIQAATAETMQDRGIRDVADLSKLVPGFTAAQSTFATPVYTLRGIGLYDTTVGAAPAVAIYTDQVPRNFPVMSDGLDLDIERVEVLKGPQGTLFGQNSTGGAVNYIVGKPTDTFEAGFDASYERFDRADIAGFVSGPLSSTLSARLAVRGVSGGAWQYSVTRPDDKNGDTRKIMGRLSLDWKPTDVVRVQASVTGARDHSDTQAPQYAGSFFNIYSAASLAAANANPDTANPYGIVDEDLYALFTTPGSPGFRPAHLTDQLTAVTRMNGVGTLSPLYPQLAEETRAILGTPVVHNNRGAEWTPGFMRGSRDHYWQGTLRADINLTDAITLTSLTAYAEKKFDHTVDLDATAAVGNDVPTFGSLRTFNQEIRVAGESDRLNWMIGANYDSAKISDNNEYLLRAYVTNDPLNGGVSGIGPLEETAQQFDNNKKAFAFFGNAEFKLIDNLTITGGLRYTKTRQKASYCATDPSASGNTNAVFTALSQAFGAPAGFVINPGECWVLGDGTGGTTDGVATIDPFKAHLTEDNWSFRAGINYNISTGGLIYASISQGYKSGVFSNIGASVVSQFVPANQEKLVSYEAGFKIPAFDNKIQINGAAFYYDYSNKQIRAKVTDPVWGLLERLINVPKSEVWGLEGEIAARPMDGLSFSASATYVKSKVTESFQTFNGSSVYNTMGFTGDLKGSELPFTPKFMANADVQYEWDMGNVRPFVGATFVFQGKSNSTFKNKVLRADYFNIPSWHTLDLRAGVAAPDGSWRLSVFGRNVFNERIVTAPLYYADVYFNQMGKPFIYGASISLRY